MKKLDQSVKLEGLYPEQRKQPVLSLAYDRCLIQSI